MDAINTILYEMDYQVCYYADEVQSTVIEKSVNHLQRKIEKRKQRKDNYKEDMNDERMVWTYGSEGEKYR